MVFLHKLWIERIALENRPQAIYDTICLNNIVDDIFQATDLQDVSPASCNLHGTGAFTLLCLRLSLS